MTALNAYRTVTPTRSAGEELSSTGEGRHITVLESDITHPTRTSGFVEKGDPVSIGASLVGVALNTATAATDWIAVDTEGIWVLPVIASNESGTSAVVIGDTLYIATGVVSKINTGIVYGKALSALEASASAANGAVKVHME